MPRLRAKARPLAALLLEILGASAIVGAVAQWSRPLAVLLLGACLVLAAVALDRGGVL